MPQEALKAHLEKLRGELDRADSLDAETRETLAELEASIERILSEGAPSRDSLRKRLETTTLEFEARHPNLSQILSDVSDTLAKMGV